MHPARQGVFYSHSVTFLDTARPWSVRIKRGLPILLLLYLWLLHNNKTMGWTIRAGLCFLQILPNISSTTVQPRSTANPLSNCSYVLSLFVSKFNVHKCRCWPGPLRPIHQGLTDLSYSLNPVVICLIQQSLTFLTELFTLRLYGFNIYNNITANFEPYTFSNSWHFL